MSPERRHQHYHLVNTSLSLTPTFLSVFSAVNFVSESSYFDKQKERPHAKEKDNPIHKHIALPDHVLIVDINEE